MDSPLVKSCHLEGACFSSGVRGSWRSVLRCLQGCLAQALTIVCIPVCLLLNQAPELNQGHVASRVSWGLSLRKGFKIHSWV